MRIHFSDFKFYLILILLFTFFSPAYSQPTYFKAVAKEGDGIFTLLRRHGLKPSEHLNTFLELNQENLGKNNSLYVGRSYLLPEASAPDPAAPSPDAAKERRTGTKASGSMAAGSVPYMGEKYAKLEIRSQQLKGAVFYLLSGHGGPDPGAIGKYGNALLAEDEYAYDVTLRLARRLMENGATVYMIIQDPNDGIRDERVLEMDNDEVHYPNLKIPLSQKQRLRDRVNAVNKLHAKHRGAYQRMLSIHIDSRSIGKNIDVFFYHHENSAVGEKLAKNIHQTFISKYKRYQPNRDYFGSVTHRNTLYVIKYSHPPTVFIELGNIQNDLDQKRFLIPDNRQALANWIAEGLVKDYTSR